MTPEETHGMILDFFQKITKYYGCRVDLTEGICTASGDFDANLTTWNLFEFELIRSAYRNKGNRFMMEGTGMYYELDAIAIISMKETGRNKFEFIEKLAESVYRITKLRFHYKY